MAVGSRAPEPLTIIYELSLLILVFMWLLLETKRPDLSEEQLHLLLALRISEFEHDFLNGLSALITYSPQIKKVRIFTPVLGWIILTFTCIKSSMQIKYDQNCQI